MKDHYKCHFLLGKTYLSLGEEKPEFFPKAYTEFLKVTIKKKLAHFTNTFYCLVPKVLSRSLVSDLQLRDK